MPERLLRAWICLALWLLAACAPAARGVAFPKAAALPGWQPGEPETYTQDNLYDLVDGQAESFFAYGFESVAVQRYTSDAGVRVRVEIWTLADEPGAFGLWTYLRSGPPATSAIGVDSDSDGARRIAFWQSRHYVQVIASQPLEAPALESFAAAVAALLPQGGERPALVARAAQDGLQEGSLLFFREEISVQDALWLGGENILGLSQETAGLTARYTLDGQDYRLLLVEYPTAEQADTALVFLQNVGLEGLLVSGVQGTRLGAVFGEQASEPAIALLRKGLAP